MEAVGPESQVEAAVSAVGLDLGDEVVLFPFGPEGPLEGVELRPNRVRVVERREALFLKEVPLSLKPPPGRRLLDYAPKTVRLVGPREALEGLAGVAATLQEALGPGEVEVAVAPDLPRGSDPGTGSGAGCARIARMVYPIRLYGDPVLRRKARPVEDFSGIKRLAEDMLETMFEAKGVGLAAPQIGLSQRLFVAVEYADEPEGRRRGP